MKRLVNKFRLWLARRLDPEVFQWFEDERRENFLLSSCLMESRKILDKIALHDDSQSKEMRVLAREQTVKIKELAIKLVEGKK